MVANDVRLYSSVPSNLLLNYDQLKVKVVVAEVVVAAEMRVAVAVVVALTPDWTDILRPAERTYHPRKKASRFS